MSNSSSSTLSHEKGKSMKNNIISFPLEESGNPVYFNCASDKADIDLIIRKLFIEIAKIDTLCDEQLDLSLELMRSAIEQRAETLKVITFNLQMLKTRLK